MHALVDFLIALQLKCLHLFDAKTLLKDICVYFFNLYSLMFTTNTLSRGVLVLLICVRIVVCLDCYFHSILIVIFLFCIILV